MLTQNRLKELLEYDPALGIFRWRVARPGGRGIKAGDIAGTPRYSGDGRGPYTWIGIDRKHYAAHHLAIFYMTGTWSVTLIDHKDTNTLNNAYDNLRPANKKQNAYNSRGHADSASGRKGVAWDGRRGKWMASIWSDGHNKFLGRFDSLDAAATAYETAARNLHGEFFCTAGVQI